MLFPLPAQGRAWDPVSRVLCWVALWLAPLSAGAAPAYAYEARLAQRALTGGSFLLAGQHWACMGTLLVCQGQLDMPRPTVAACQALVRRVGAVVAFGRVGGAALGAADLVACNVQARDQPPAALPRRDAGLLRPVALFSAGLRPSGNTRS